MQLHTYDVIGITETWWDSSQDRSAAVNGYRLFRKDSLRMQGGGVALYAKEH